MERTTVSRQPVIRATGLRDILDGRGLKHVWVARNVGVSKPHFSGIVAGRVNVNPVHAERICELLAVPFFLAFEFTEKSESAEVERLAS